jgi:hypothetical protein
VVLPNMPRLNSNVMRWAIRSGRRRGIAVGGNQTEIPEWCDFVLAKTGYPGPYVNENSTRILREAAQEGSAVRRHFSPLASWPSPDGQEIALYRRRREPDGGPARRILGDLSVRAADLTNVRLVRLSTDTYRVEADSVLLRMRGLKLTDVRARLEGAELVFDEGRAHVMRVRTVALESLRLPWAELSEAASRGLPGLAVTAQAGGNSLDLELSWKGLRARLGAAWSQGPDEIIFRARGLRLLGVPIPFVSGRVFKLSLAPRPPQQPYRLRLARLHADAQGIAVGD